MNECIVKLLWSEIPEEGEIESLTKESFVLYFDKFDSCLRTCLKLEKITGFPVIQASL
jgi:hypothetical protein